jgi:hypothetical protein
MPLLPTRAFARAPHRQFVQVLRLLMLGAAFAAGSCAPDAGGKPATQTAAANGMHVELTSYAGEPTSGEAQSLPEIVYAGRRGRVGVTLTDSEFGVPVQGPVQVSAKVVATTWVGPRRPLKPVAPEDGRYEGHVEVPTHGPYRIDVEVEVPTGRSYLQFGFDY